MNIDELKAKGYAAKYLEGYIQGVACALWAIYDPQGKYTGASGETEDQAWMEFAWLQV